MDSNYIRGMGRLCAKESNVITLSIGRALPGAPNPKSAILVASSRTR